MSIYNQIANLPLRSNPVGSFQQGKQYAQNNRLADLQLQQKQMELDALPEQNRLSGLLNNLKIQEAQQKLNNPDAVDPTAHMQNYNFYQKLDPEQRKVFQSMMRSPKVQLIGQVPNQITPTGPVPLSTLDKEVEAKAALAGATESAQQEQKFKWGPMIIKAQKEAETRAKSTGEAFTDLNRMKASLPGLMEVTKNLSALADTATYTLFGQGFNWAAKQLGFGATQGATDRAKFESIVDNQVLPLLRQTFGAAFTAAEGDRLRATLGNVNLSPSEKKAQLDAFIQQKVRNIEANEREINLNQGTQNTSIPAGVSPELWGVMTPQERAAFQ